MVVVAEAIETDEQLDELACLKCDVGQGYLFARPLAPATVAELRRSAPQSVLPSAPLNGRRNHVGAKHGG